MKKGNEENNIGMKVKWPEKTCNDSKCPFHGSLRIRGRIFTGKVVSAKMQRSAVVQWERKRLITKFERYEKRRTKVKAHNPDCINAKQGDIVKIAECRPLSKLKSFVIIEVEAKK